MQSTHSKILAFIKSLYPDKEIVALHEPTFAGNEKRYINECIDSTFVSSVGHFVNRLETVIPEITGAKFAVAVVNGTAALHTALLIAGVNAGDEVITQALTFVATANAISYCNAKPVFLDVDMETLGLSPEALDQFLKRNTRLENGKTINSVTGRRIAACVPVHALGHPCRIDEIISICRGYNIDVIEDAAEALGSTFKERAAGTFGRLGIFSFNGNKIVTCGGGGIVVTDDEAVARQAKHLTTTAKLAHPFEYVHDRIGFNYRLPNLNAALACAQLEKLAEFIADKRALAESYHKFFTSLGISFIREPKDAKSNCWLNAILFADRRERDEFLNSALKEGVMARPLWTQLNELDIYKNCQSDDLNCSRHLIDRVVNIPSSVSGRFNC